MNAVYVTGNPHKAKYFNKMVGIELEHRSADLQEIQSLNLAEIIEHKAKTAFDVLQKPVIVEDTKLTFAAMGALPGPYIKWFLDELGVDGLCRLLDGKSRSATAGAAIAYYDGTTMRIFEKELSGMIADNPSGDNGFGWNQIFIPDGAQKTLGEMPEPQFEVWYAKIKPFQEVAEFLERLQAA